MSDNTGIQWTDATWPVVTGCTHLSEGCDHCYAAKLTSGRLKHQPAYAGLAEGGRFNGTVRCLPERLDWPLHWRKPRMIFVANMGDLFHDSVPDEFIARVFAVMAATPQHTYQVLTKRHGRMRSLLNSKLWWQYAFAAACRDIGADYATTARWSRDDTAFLPNVWLGVSAENEKWFDIRSDALLDTPAAVRFVSAEPLLGPIRMRASLLVGAALEPRGGIGWVIVGGESGPGARPCELVWIEDIVNQCHEAEIPVFVKQFGAILGREFDAGSHGADWEKWPPYLQHRHFPVTAEAVPA